MTDTTKRKPAALPIQIQPVMVSHEVAAAMLGQISVRLLDRLVAQGKLTARQISAGRVGYLRRDVEALAESLPVVTPGVQAARAADPAA